jgi:hypothetical protein
MLSEFLFEFLDGVGPVDRFGSLVVIRDVLVEKAFEIASVEKVIRLQVLALKQTEPDFELIQPGGIGRQPEDLIVQLLFAGAFLFTEPAFELFGSVRGSIVQDEDHRLHLALTGFGKNDLLEKGLEIDKALAASADT